MKNNILLLLFLGLFCNTLLAQTIEGSFVWDNELREYRLYVPAGYVEGEVLPLVLNFHGFSSNAFQQQIYSGMDQVADTANFFVVYPEGISSAWNVGWAFGSTADDVGFTNALIDTIHAEYGINLDRVYATGMSNGGFFSYRLACELNHRIAKIASVTGSMVNAAVSQCMPDNPIPVMQIHGTADDVVNYNGTTGISIPIESLLTFWLNSNGCAMVSDTIFVEDINMSDQSTAQLIQYRDCDDNVYLSFYKIIGGGHTWPGASLIFGVTNQDFNASAEIWNFFNDQYPLEEDLPVSSGELNIAGQQVNVFPNPFQTNFLIQSNTENIESIQIFNALGQLVYVNDNINAKVFEVNNVEWQKGFYLIQIKTENRRQTIRAVKG